jgi:hypothetical protein
LSVDRVQSSCGCTAAIAGKKTLAPQETSEIEVTFNSAGRQGQFNKTIQVFSNDPLMPRVALRIDGMILTPFTIQPQYLNLGTVSVGQQIEKEVQIKLSAYEKPVRITQIDKTSRLEVTMRNSLVTREAWTTLVVKLAPHSSLGYLNENVTLRFEDPNIPPVTIRVSGRVEGSIRVQPNRVSFVIKEDFAEAIPQKIQISRLGLENFEITKTEIDPNFFDVETVVKENGKSYEVIIRLKEKTEERFFSRVLKIYTTDESMKLIEIPIQVFVPNRSKS